MILSEISEWLQKGRAPQVKELVQKALDEGIDPKKRLATMLTWARLPLIHQHFIFHNTSSLFLLILIILYFLSYLPLKSFKYLLIYRILQII